MFVIRFFFIGMDFTKRLPMGEVEKLRKAVAVFLTIRRFTFMMKYETDTALPLVDIVQLPSVDQALDLSMFCVGCLCVYIY